MGWFAGKSVGLIGFLDTLMPAVALSSRDQAVLDFERSWWLIAGPKERAIKEQLDMGATEYYRALKRLTGDPAAVEYDPLTVRRLQKAAARKPVRRSLAEEEDV